MFNPQQPIIDQSVNTDAYQAVAASFYPNPQAAPQQEVVRQALAVFGYTDSNLQDRVRDFKKDWNLLYSAGALPNSYMGIFNPTNGTINDGVLNAIAWLWAEPRAMLDMRQGGQFKGKADLTRDTVLQGQPSSSWTPNFKPAKLGFISVPGTSPITGQPTVTPGGQATGEPIDTTPVLESKLSTIATNTPGFVQINFIGRNLSASPDIAVISQDGSVEVPIATADIQSDTIYAIGVPQDVPPGIYDVFLIMQDDSGDEIATKQAIQLKAPEDFDQLQQTQLPGNGNGSGNGAPPISCPSGTFATLDEISGNWFCANTPPPQILPTPPAQQQPPVQPAAKKKSSGGMGPLLLLGGLGALLIFGSKKG